MKIIDDKEFIASECRKIWPSEAQWAIDAIANKRGQFVVCISREDRDKGIVFCKVMDGDQYWFPKSCIEGYEPEELLQILPDGTLGPVMDLRDYFAAHVMSARLSGFPSPDADLFAYLARQAYEAADAMMEARKK